MPGEKILIVDDNADLLKFLKHYCLFSEGYEVLTAADGKTAFEMLAEETPDLILTDLNMPQWSGIDLVKAIRNADISLPIIVMTVHGSEQLVAEVFRLGIQDYLMKPFTLEEVGRAINRALTHVRLKQEKENLEKELLAVEATRQTVITLAHYINNSLMVVKSGLELIGEEIERHPIDRLVLAQLINDSRSHADRISSVLTILQQVTEFNTKPYTQKTDLIDIEQALAHAMDSRLSADEHQDFTNVTN